MARTWISSPRPAMLYFVARSYICKLCIYIYNYTIIWAVTYNTYCYFSTCGPWNWPTTGVVLCHEKSGDPLARIFPTRNWYGILENGYIDDRERDGTTYLTRNWGRYVVGMRRPSSPLVSERLGYVNPFSPFFIEIVFEYMRTVLLPTTQLLFLCCDTQKAHPCRHSIDS